MVRLSITQIGRCAAFAALGALVAACDLSQPTSEYPLANASIEDGGERLIGAWYGEIDGAEAYVHVLEDADGSGMLETLLISHTRRGQLGPWGKGYAQPSQIGGARFISVEMDEDQNGEISDPEQRGFHIFRYDVGRGYVTLFGPDQALLAEAIERGQLDGVATPPNARRPNGTVRVASDADDFIAFVEEVGAERLFSEPQGYLERVSEDRVPDLRFN